MNIETDKTIPVFATSSDPRAATTAVASKSLYSAGDSINFSQPACSSTDECFFRQKSKLAEGKVEKGVVFYEKYVDGKPTGQFFSGRIQTGNEHNVQLQYQEEIEIKSGPNAGTYKFAGNAHSHPANFNVTATVNPKKAKTKTETAAGVFSYGEIVTGIQESRWEIAAGSTGYGHSTPLHTSSQGDGENDLASIAEHPGKPSYVLDRLSGSAEKIVYDKEAQLFQAYDAHEGATTFVRCDNDICIDGTRVARVREAVEKEGKNKLGDEWREWSGKVWTDAGEAKVRESVGTSNPNADWRASQMQGKATTETPSPKQSVEPITMSSSVTPTPVQGQSREVSSVAPSVAQTYATVDYRELKKWGTDLLNDTYSKATGIADAEGFGAEYRSRAQPVLNEGLNYIQGIPDQVQVPVGQQ